MDKCPECNAELSYDEVDIGVGIQRGNFRCDDCGWSEQKEKVVERMERHKFEVYNYPPGAIEICVVCGAQRVCTIPGYSKSATYLNGHKQSYCPRKMVGMNKSWITCNQCNSKGYIGSFIKCPKCYGRGFVPEKNSKGVNIVD